MLHKLINGSSDLIIIRTNAWKKNETDFWFHSIFKFLSTGDIINPWMNGVKYEYVWLATSEEFCIF